MTIQASGTMRTGAIRTEYGGGVPMRLGNYRRGHASLFVRANSGDNAAVNGSAGVPAVGSPLRMSHFYGKKIGWTYTNSVVRTNNYHCHTEFGSDWLGANGTNWPCFYINNNGIYSTSTSYYALVIYGRQNNGPFTFTNNSEIQGAGGQTTSAAGQHACYIYNSENAVYANRPIIINNYAFRGGGGGGGQGGTGGTGGQGMYNYTAQEGPIYQKDVTQVLRYKQAQGWWWAGLGKFYQDNNPNLTAVGNGIYVYYRDAQQQAIPDGQGGTSYYYSIFRQWTATAYGTAGGAGGGGGAGGRGIGYNSPNLGGAGGAGGGAPGTNAGWGGTGGTGGTGGSWGQNGATGNTGATGQSGNYTGGAAGGGGTGGGPAGYSIYAATKWGLANYNTLNGPYGGGVAPS